MAERHPQRRTLIFFIEASRLKLEVDSPVKAFLADGFSAPCRLAGGSYLFRKSAVTF